MMTLRNNPYEDLLKYFQAYEQQPKKKPPVKEKLEKKVEKPEVSDTKKLLEESKIHGYIPGDTFENPPPKKSDGFDVSTFELMMRAKLIEEHKKMQSYERPYISVTELTSCTRQCYYNRMKYPVNNKQLYTFSYLYIIQKVGNTIHDIIQGLYNFSETEKTIVSERYKVKGRVDGIRDSFIFEIKSIDPEKFKNKYVREHYMQAVIYAYILNKEYSYDIKTITIIYVMRNLKKIVPFDLPLDDKLAESLLSKAPILKSSLESHQVPDPFGATKEMCKYCLYSKQCKEDKCSTVVQPFKKKTKNKEAEQKEIPRKKKPPMPTQDEKDKKTAFLL